MARFKFTDDKGNETTLDNAAWSIMAEVQQALEADTFITGTIRRSHPNDPDADKPGLLSAVNIVKVVAV